VPTLVYEMVVQFFVRHPVFSTDTDIYIDIDIRGNGQDQMWKPLNTKCTCQLFDH